jgi:hypothetical protein
LDAYFDISATYRIKRSGSADVPQREREQIIREIKNIFPNSCEKQIAGDKHLYLEPDENMKNARFEFDGSEYYINASEKGYVVKKLSKTCNRNVIFSISLIKENGLSKDDFISFLTSL